MRRVQTTPILRAEALTAERGERPLFTQLTFTLEPGQLVWLRGRNGRGKTTLLRLLAGLAAPATGRVTLDSVPLSQCAQAWRQRMVYIAHANALRDELSVAEALAFLSRLHGRAATDAAIDEALGQLGIAAYRQAIVRTLSQGQRRRAALARLALAPPAGVWLLDEPFDALDDEGIASLGALLGAHLAAGGSVLLTSHQPLGAAMPVPRVLDLDACAAA